MAKKVIRFSRGSGPPQSNSRSATEAFWLLCRQIRSGSSPKYLVEGAQSHLEIEPPLLIIRASLYRLLRLHGNASCCNGHLSFNTKHGFLNSYKMYIYIYIYIYNYY